MDTVVDIVDEEFHVRDRVGPRFLLALQRVDEFSAREVQRVLLDLSLVEVRDDLVVFVPGLVRVRVEREEHGTDQEQRDDDPHDGRHQGTSAVRVLIVRSETEPVVVIVVRQWIALLLLVCEYSTLKIMLKS